MPILFLQNNNQLFLIQTGSGNQMTDLSEDRALKFVIRMKAILCILGLNVTSADISHRHVLMSWLHLIKFGQICKFSLSTLNCELQLCSREKRGNQILNNDIDWLSASHPDIRADTVRVSPSTITICCDAAG